MEAKEMVKKYLDERAAKDEIFAKVYKNPDKSMNECWRFILGEARKRGSAVCMSDAEVYGLAVHYYDEDDLKVEKVKERVEVACPAEEKAKEMIRKAGKAKKERTAAPTPKPSKKQREKLLDKLQLSLFPELA